MKKVPTLWVLLLACTCLFSQNDQRIAKTKIPLTDIEKIVMPAQDNAALLDAEMQRRGPGIAPKFAVNLEVNISPDTHGKWERLANGKALWRLRILSTGAKSLNLGFTKYNMPRGGSLILYSPDKGQVMGPFTPSDNEVHEQLWTPILDGDAMVVEVQVPAQFQNQLELELKYVNHDFLGFHQLASGSCNLDVICGQGDGWDIVEAYRDIIQSVAAISTGGSAFCTGFLVNNARQDCTPYFMTANHCGIGSGQAPSLVAYWNFENSTCRQPNSPQSGGLGDGSLADFNTGSIWRAGYSTSDFTLLELDDPVSETANAFYAGWTAESTAPSDTVITIHHPSGDEKRISFEFQPTFRSEYLGTTPTPNGNHITVEDWDIGTTEGGSSGAPIFDNQKRVFGQLHGGFAACGNNDLDSYGFFHTSWEGGGTPATRLKDWLDPDNTGILVLDGRAAMQCNFFVDASPLIAELCAPAEAQFTISVSENFTADVDLSIVGLPAGLSATFDTSQVAPGGSTTLTIGNTEMVAAGSYTFRVEGTDGTESNFTDLTLNVASDIPAAATLSSPTDGAVDVALTPALNWSGLGNATYQVQVATDVDFNNLEIDNSNLTNNDFQITNTLASSQEYYWRVKASNICGEGEWSEVFSFTTASVACAAFEAEGLPITIPSSGTPSITSTIEVSSFGEIDDVNVNNINISHTWVSDLRIELTSPSGTTIELMNNVFNGTCDGINASLGFDDQSANPYSVLNGMCNPTIPALEGIFQPSEALAAFAGEEAMGTWTLTVFDDADLDGGALENWELEVCTLIPNNMSVNASMDAVASCTQDEVSFNISLGAGFDPTNGVSLSANGLPAGAMAIFNPNPAQPGAQVEVTLSGATDAGVFDIEIVADDGMGTGSALVQWAVNSGPDATTLVSPADNANDVSLNSSLNWSAVNGATGYQVTVATDPDFNNVVFVFIVEGFNAANLPDLDYCSTYYWRVNAFDDCGESDASEVFSFTTEDDLSFNAPLIDLLVCNGVTFNVPVNIGDCFESGGITLSADNVPMGASVEFPMNPVFANSTVDIAVTISNVASGVYTFIINGDDGVNAVSTDFEIEVAGAVAPANLVSPTNGEADVLIQPMLSWDPVPGAINYIFELATDADFTDIVHQVDQTSTVVDLPIMLKGLTNYFWRVTAFNDCGGTTSAPFNFTTEDANAVVEVDGLQLEILPNPTDGILQIISTSPLQENIEIKVFAVNGIQLLERKIEQGGVRSIIDLTNYPAGIYLLQLSTATAQVTERIILK